MVGMKCLFLFFISFLVAQAEDLFDGLSLNNWGIQAAEKKWWRVEDEAVVGGIKNNIELHKKILKNSDFRQNSYNTNFLAQKMVQ